MAVIGTNIKNRALNEIASAIEKNKEKIIIANKLDMESGNQKGLNKSFLDRLLLNDKRIFEMSEGLRQVANLPDPIGDAVKMWKRPNGLQIAEIKVPLGVIGIIYESRPNVTVDAAALCLKSGNSVILRGGSEAINSNTAIAHIISDAAEKAGLPKGCVQLLEITDREAVNVMMKLNKLIDVIIPRGGAGLIKNIVENSIVPVIQTGIGNCHVYVDSDADFKMAEDIIINAKVQRPSACNAIETIIIHRDIAESFLPSICKKLMDMGVELRGCSYAKNIVKEIKIADEFDFETEYLDLILAIKVVNTFDEALDHIYKYGTKHSEAIVTNNYFNAQRFLREVDAAVVYVNASTRFTDGFQFGFGAEIGISTQKLHTRGPMGLNELTTIKYMIYGDGQIRE